VAQLHAGRWALLSGGLLALAGVGCAGPAPADEAATQGPGRVSDPSQRAAALIDALAPQRLVVHPLSRLEKTAAGEWTAALHVELTDRFGHAGKWLGVLVLTLEAPSDIASDESLRGQGLPEPHRRWEIDLSDPAANAEAFDWVTHTYRLVRGQLPDWAVRFAEGRGNTPWLGVRAELQTWDGAGATRTLAGEGRLPRPG
jgi:hypothetical protein